MTHSNNRPERHRGPVTLRRDAVTTGTADQALLDSAGRPDWKIRDSWRTLRILSEFVEGFDTLSDLPPAVSVFGSARSAADSPECDMARRPIRERTEMGGADSLGELTQLALGTLCDGEITVIGLELDL